MIVNRKETLRGVFEACKGVWCALLSVRYSMRVYAWGGVLGLSMVLIRAQAPAEAPLFDAAVKALQDGFFRRAEQDFAEFGRLFPQSSKASEATSLRTHARAEALLKEEDFREAALTFERLLASDPVSPRRLDTVLGLAWARYKLNEIRKAFEILSANEAGILKADAKLSTGADERIIRGCLMLGEVGLELQEFQVVESVLSRIEGVELSARWAWQKQFLKVRLFVARNEIDKAAGASLPLVTLAKDLPGGGSYGESALLRAEVLSKQGLEVETFKALELGLSTNVPTHLRRRSMFQMAGLLKSKWSPAESIQRLDGLSKSNALEGVLDIVQWVTSELWMRRYFELGITNRAVEGRSMLSQGRAHLNLLVLTNPPSEFRGLAHYQLGWGWWEENVLDPSVERVRAAETNFENAIKFLSRSEEQMISTFKLGDVLALKKDYLGAVTNYLKVVADFPEWSQSKQVGHDQAYYQLARMWVELRDLPKAREASRIVNDKYPGSPFGERSLLLVAQEMNRQSSPSEARSLFEQMVASYPGSASMPEAQLGIARSYEREDRWLQAGEIYRKWLLTHTNHPIFATVEYYLAAASAHAGSASNSFPLFTNFLARYPAHNFAPRAQNWIADYYFERGDYVPAEENYQRLYSNTNWNEVDIMYRARYWAARCSFLRQAFTQSRLQLTALINLLNEGESVRTNGVPNLLEEAWYLLGDTLSTEADHARVAEGFQEAINAFNRIPATNYLAPKAWGRIAGCHLALATVSGNVINTNRFGESVEYFKRAIAAPNADIATRSLAEFGLGQTLQEYGLAVEQRDRERLLREALGHYLQVFYEKNRREGESSYPYAVQKCGIAAVNACEALGRYSEALSLSKRLLEIFPALRGLFEERLKSLERQVVTQEG